MSDHVLIISHERVGERMAGPGIRCFQLARVLGREFSVKLAVPHTPEAGLPVECVPYQRHVWSSLAPHLRGARVVVIPSDTACEFPQLAETNTPLVIDGYNPLLAEYLHTHAEAGTPIEEQMARWRERLHVLHGQFRVGDFFICASERQRDWWLGLLEAHGRINPYTFGADPSLRRLVDVVSYGLPGEPPQHTRAVVRDVWSGVGLQDRVVLWGGGLWPWLDPFTAIGAIARLWPDHPDIRLIFPGTRHPNPAMAQFHDHRAAALALADELGLCNKAVFFGDWTSYEDWSNVLLESDVALTLHRTETLESRLAFRSRVLDYFWAGLPVVATRGDATADMVEKFGVGEVVAPGDVGAVARAIERWLAQPKDIIAGRLADARVALSWERVVEPLRAFCRQPRRAPDRVALGDRLGNPVYVDRLAALTNQLGRYERMKYIRMLHWLHPIWQKLGWLPKEPA